MDSGASHSYASSTAIKLFGTKCKSVGVRQIVMLTGVTTLKLHVYDASVESLNKDFVLDVSLTKIQKNDSSAKSPRFKEILTKFHQLDGVYIDDYDEKDTLPVHLISGANEYAKIRTNEDLRVGKTGEPVAEHTRFEWALMSPGEFVGSTFVAAAKINRVDEGSYLQDRWRWHAQLGGIKFSPMLKLQ